MYSDNVVYITVVEVNKQPELKDQAAVSTEHKCIHVYKIKH